MLNLDDVFFEGEAGAEETLQDVAGEGDVVAAAIQGDCRGSLLRFMGPRFWHNGGRCDGTTPLTIRVKLRIIMPKGAGFFEPTLMMM